MTDAQRQALQDAHTACLASADAIAAVLAEDATTETSGIARDAFVTLKTAAAVWGIEDDSARKRVKRLIRERSEWVTKRGAGRWWVHREALR